MPAPSKCPSTQSRPRRLNLVALKETVEWFERVRSLWSDSFDRLEARLRANEKVSKRG